MQITQVTQQTYPPSLSAGLPRKACSVVGPTTTPRKKKTTLQRPEAKRCSWASHKKGDVLFAVPRKIGNFF